MLCKSSFSIITLYVVHPFLVWNYPIQSYQSQKILEPFLEHQVSFLYIFPCSTLETLALYRYNSTKRTVMLWVCIDILNSVSFHRMSTWIILLLNWIPAEIWGNKLLYLSIPCLSKQLKSLGLIAGRSRERR
jgi:hypothetical protein